MTQPKLVLAFVPAMDTWYHVAILWKSTFDGQIALMLDGRPVGTFSYVDDGGQKIGTYLTSDLSDTDDEIEVKDTRGFPPVGAIRIGAEVIEYSSKTDTSFKVRTDYDPRRRTWYTQASEQASLIKPYFFYFIGKVGTTATLKTARPGVVIAA